MLHIDLKYVNLLSNRFERFVRKDDYLFNVRCPICGDSKTKKTKMRGYIYRVKQNMAYKCHNCNASMGLSALIKHLDPNLAKEYALETFKESRQRPARQNLKRLLTEPGFFDNPPVRFGKIAPVIYHNAERVINLPEQHYCRQYVMARRVPKELWHKLYFTEHYRLFVDEVFPNHGKIIEDDARLVIPYYSMYDEVVAMTGRALANGNHKLRYVTVRAHDDTKKLVYGMDRVDQSKRVYVVEGPLDSLFIHNAVASGDSNLIQAAETLSAANIVLVYDNEPRNKELVRQMEKAIKSGYKIVVWPDWLREKDINAMVMADYVPSALEKLIDTHTYSGLQATTHLTFWKKV